MILERIKNMTPVIREYMAEQPGFLPVSEDILRDIIRNDIPALIPIPESYTDESLKKPTNAR